MNKKSFLKISLSIVTIVLLLLFFTNVIVEPWIGKKIQAALNESNKDFSVEIGKVNLSIWNSGIELEKITISSRPEQKEIRDLKGEIASIKLKGIRFAKFIFERKISIRSVNIFNSTVSGKIPFQEKAKPPKISHFNIQIDSLFFDRTNLDIRNTQTAQTISVKDLVLKVYDLNVAKLDTLTPAIIKKFSFDSQKLLSVSADSMYTMTALGINYSAKSNMLALDSFSVQPNYSDYEFTARHQFTTDRIEAVFAPVHIHDFSAAGYLKSGKLVSSYVEIGKMNMNVFRDNRKEKSHVIVVAFQDLIYNYPEVLNIDSIGLLNGNISYTEHAEKANEPGKISFNEIHAKIYKISNDIIYKTKSAFLKFKADALIMGKSRLDILLKAGIFDNQNTFSVNGTLSGMEINELNPMLEKNAFISVKSGKMDEMSFSFTANNTHATGQMTFLYHDLDIAIINKQTDDTKAIKERFMSFIANKKLLNSNPIPGEEVRVGVIGYERDPEKFLFNYFIKSIMTGIKSSLIKNQKK